MGCPCSYCRRVRERSNWEGERYTAQYFRDKDTIRSEKGKRDKGSYPKKKRKNTR